ncbi:hypothetical protein [Mariniplasma anaerobium]|uniref:Uncharacterized protein n=1 Tax=Mariniplasma anaerobium TaxID=2735436 RepID=A0A7U9XUI7_9MOLU|nr:hypothetical protein [Mariniplasma anaerobium]BCR35810.1 hypothetical protein MPAN_007030 [Mariniplasma anaerobium]
MFEIMIFTLINAFWVTLVIGTLTLLSLRVIYSLQFSYTIKEKLMIWFIPLSIGFYHLEDKKNVISRIYRIFVVIFFITAILAFLFVLYTEMELMII